MDTNFLLIPAQFKVDIFSEFERMMPFTYELYIIDKTIDELNNIAEKQRGKNREAAKLALALLDRYPIRHLKTAKTERHLNVDKLILKRLKTAKYVVATQDVALKREVRKNNTQLVVLRKKKYLMLV